jgi:1L-myo-inositol 1-phosphate cytidylyltransferase
MRSMATHLTDDPVRQAIVLAAGNGDRFHSGSAHSKLLTPVAGTPLLIRTLAAAANAGITDAHLVLGYDADCVRGLVSSQTPSGLKLHFHLNRDWHRENGLSVLAARSSLDPQPFALMMGDHLFETDVLRRLLEFPRRPSEALLGVDTYAIESEMADEATKVRLDDGRVTAIGKMLRPYDALDTGLFVCDRSVFEAIEASCVDGDSTLSGGIARLAARGLVRGVDIGRARWCDVDTLADLAIGERLVAQESCA